jgi:hypothetical protein
MENAPTDATLPVHGGCLYHRTIPPLLALPHVPYIHVRSLPDYILPASQKAGQLVDVRMGPRRWVQIPKPKVRGRHYLDDLREVLQT